MASKIAQLRKELSKLKPSKFQILSSSCTISYNRKGKEYLIYLESGRLLTWYYSFEHLLEKIKELQEYEKYEN